MNPSEAFVYKVCRKSFLSLWSYAKPKGKKGKELCDILVVCDPDVIIFSVKKVKLVGSGEDPVDTRRWDREAVEGSRRQLYGAGRWIQVAQHVIRQDGTQGLPFPPLPERRIHRVAVALGGGGKVWMASGDLGKGYVHVLDEVAFGAIVRELDTVTDFVKYLCAKEELVRQGTGVLCFGEEDLLALYLRNGRRFPDKPDQLIVGGDLWAGLRRERAYRAKKKADKISYAWDNLIETFCADALQGRLEFGGGLTEVEQAIRTMAREDRFCRRMLGQAFVDFIQTCAQKKLRSRVIESESGVVYVFLVQPRGSPREHRKRELTLRCFVARGVHKNREVVVGIATERPENGKGFSLDLVSLKMPAWTQENQVVMDGIQAELGYFWKPVRTSHSEDEYPN